MENKKQHLEMIQSIIQRMTSNSFALKGWAVSLIAGIFVLSSKDTDKAYFLIAYVPIIIFWGLDAYYLLQERLLRSLYNKVRKLDDNDVDFDMTTDLPEFKTKKTTYLNCLFSVSGFWFYFPLALLTAGIIIITHV